MTPVVRCFTCNADDAELAKRMEFILSELKKVQDKLGDGYLSAFPTEHFERLQKLQPVWAPFYVVRHACIPRTDCMHENTDGTIHFEALSWNALQCHEYRA